MGDYFAAQPESDEEEEAPCIDEVWAEENWDTSWGWHDSNKALVWWERGRRRWMKEMDGDGYGWKTWYGGEWWRRGAKATWWRRNRQGVWIDASGGPVPPELPKWSPPR